MLADSLLGATLQASYFCPQCNKPTESRVHRCGTPTTLVRGQSWITNDVVNLAGTLVGALVSLIVYLLVYTGADSLLDARCIIKNRSVLATGGTINGRHEYT